MTTEATEHVYVIGPADARTVKIGRTVDLAKRLGDIQRMSPFPLQLLWSHPGGHVLETHLHRQFCALRTHGEWFTFTNDPVSLIKWAVETEPWRKKRVSLKKRPPALRIVRRTGEERRAAREAQAGVGPEVEAELQLMVDSIQATLEPISDPVERYKAVVELENRLGSEFRKHQANAVKQMRDEGKTWREVGDALHVSGQRAFQIASGQ